MKAGDSVRTIDSDDPADANGAALTFLDPHLNKQFSAIFPEAGVWTFANDRLPILIGANGGQSSDLPAYMRTAQARDLRIATAAELAKLAADVNGGVSDYAGQRVYLTKDIDLSGYRTAAGWTPIGNSVHPFKGAFDGADHTVSNLTIHAPDADDQGLFGAVGAGGTVKNLNVTDCGVADKNSVGGVAGRVDGTVESCSVTGSVTGAKAVGGVAGDVSGTVRSCRADSRVTAAGEGFDAPGAGGVAGTMTDSGTVNDCYATGSVTAAGSAGGVAGQMTNGGAVAACYATGRVTGGPSGAAGGKERQPGEKPTVFLVKVPKFPA